MNDEPARPDVAARFSRWQSGDPVRMQPTQMESRRPADTKEALAKSGARGTIGNLAMVTAGRARLTTSPRRFKPQMVFCRIGA
jgi:hypothetical protein